jgi:hypothetical protein
VHILEFQALYLFFGYIPLPNRVTPKKFHTICSNLTDDRELGNLIADFKNWYLTWGDTDNV